MDSQETEEGVFQNQESNHVFFQSSIPQRSSYTDRVISAVVGDSFVTFLVAQFVEFFLNL